MAEPVGRPRSVAIVGASRDRRKFGNKAVRAYLERGYTVFPINPRAREIEGLEALASLRDLPGPVDMVSFYVPPSVGLAVLEDLAAIGDTELWLNPGSESPALLERAASLGVRPIRACSIRGIGEDPGAW